MNPIAKALGNIQRTQARLAACRTLREVRTAHDELLAQEWAEHLGSAEPSGLEYGLAKAGQYPPTAEEMAAWTPRPPDPRPGGAFVYLIGGGGRVKIGASDGPVARLRSLQVGSPVPLQLIAVTGGGYDLERELHLRFRALRSHGEWFFETEEILEVFGALRPIRLPASTLTQASDDAWKDAAE